MHLKADQPPLIVHVIYSLGPGGLENGLVNIINRTPNSRYRHAIVCLTESGSFASRLEKEVIIVALHGQQGHDFTLYWKLWKALRSLKPTIVHTRNLSALEAQIPTLFIPGVKTVHGVHGRDVFDLEGKNRKYNILRKLIRPLVGRYITVSRDLGDWLVTTVGVRDWKVTQIYNGVDQTRFVPGTVTRENMAPAGFLPDDAVVIGTVGRLAEVKDQATLVKAFKRVLERKPSSETCLRLVIVGGGPLQSNLKRLVSELGLENLVWMAGDRDDIPEVLRFLDIFVLPSLGEGISNTILEAMATALPVIATRVGGNPELIEHGVNGYLVPPRDTKKLAEGIEQLADNREMRRVMGQAGLKKVQKQFHWDKTVESYLAVYDQLLTTKNS